MKHYQTNNSQSKENSSEEYAFEYREAKAQEFDTFSTNVGKNTFELTQRFSSKQ